MRCRAITQPVTAEVVQVILSRQLDDLEPRLTRDGCDVRNLAEQFQVKPAEIKLFLRRRLDAARTRELTDQMLRSASDERREFVTPEAKEHRDKARPARKARPAAAAASRHLCDDRMCRVDR